MSPGTFTNHTLLLDYLNQNDTIAVEIVDVEDSDSAMNKKFDWTISTYTQYEMQISLEFENPRDISQQSIDTVRVTFYDTSLLFDAQGQILEAGTEVSKIIPS